jgi:hypothetical protein
VSEIPPASEGCVTLGGFALEIGHLTSSSLGFGMVVYHVSGLQVCKVESPYENPLDS